MCDLTLADMGIKAHICGGCGAKYDSPQRCCRHCGGDVAMLSSEELSREFERAKITPLGCTPKLTLVPGR